MRKDKRRWQIGKIQTHKRKRFVKNAQKRRGVVLETKRMIRQINYALKYFGKGTARIIETMSKKDPITGEFPRIIKVGRLIAERIEKTINIISIRGNKAICIPPC